MLLKSFSIAEALKFGLYTMLDHIGLFFLIMLTGFGIHVLRWQSLFTWVGGYLSRSLMNSPNVGAQGVLATDSITDLFSIKAIAITGILYLIYKILDSVYTLGFTRITLDLYDQQQTSYERLWCCWRLIFRQLVAAFIYYGVLLLGLGIFVVPGILWGIKFFFFQHAIVYQQLGILDAFKQSACITYGAKKQLFALIMVLGVLHTMAIYAFGSIGIFIGTVLSSGLFLFLCFAAVGLTITVPLSSLATAYVYRTLLAFDEKA
jgi:hypothetical protein